jgi:hypothetical protein
VLQAEFQGLSLFNEEVSGYGGWYLGHLHTSAGASC